MRGLYAILDLATLSAASIDPLDFARAVLPVRPAALQLRAKDHPAREILGLLRALRPLCSAFDVPLVANDRADLAALGGADMVHLGQEDVPLELVRRLSPNLKVGLSTHNLEQLSRALLLRPDYVAYGPVYATKSKTNPDEVVGLAGLEAAAALIAARAPGTPLVAIGGITVERARQVTPFADSAAVIAALVSDGASEVARRAEIFQSILAAPKSRGGIASAIHA